MNIFKKMKVIPIIDKSEKLVKNMDLNMAEIGKH